MTEHGPHTLSLHESLYAALRARHEEIRHASSLGRRAEVLEDICVQLLHEFDGIVPDWEDSRLRALVYEAIEHLDRADD